MKNLLENGPEHFVGPPFSAGRVLVRANDGAIDNGADLIYLELDLLKDAGPMTFSCPVREPVVDGLPRTKPLG